jgi:hypothetical protein
MFWTFNLSLDILATVWATLPNIGQIFVQFSGHSACNSKSTLDVTATNRHNPQISLYTHTDSLGWIKN